MATLDDVLAKVAEQKTQVESLVALIAGLKQKLADALATVPPPAVPAELQSKIDAVFADLASNSDAIISAINANTQ